MGAMKKIWLGLSGEKLAGGLKMDTAHDDRVVVEQQSDNRDGPGGYLVQEGRIVDLSPSRPNAPVDHFPPPPGGAAVPPGGESPLTPGSSDAGSAMAMTQKEPTARMLEN
jgi:hypothetical protein